MAEIEQYAAREVWDPPTAPAQRTNNLNPADSRSASATRELTLLAVGS